MAELITLSALDMRDALPDGGGLIGLDLGTQTIGTAFADPEWRIASPGKTIARGKFSVDKLAIAGLIEERGIKGIVIGLPLNMDGTSGPRAIFTRIASARARASTASGTPSSTAIPSAPPSQRA